VNFILFFLLPLFAIALLLDQVIQERDNSSVKELENELQNQIKPLLFTHEYSYFNYYCENLFQKVSESELKDSIFDYFNTIHPRLWDVHFIFSTNDGKIITPLKKDTPYRSILIKLNDDLINGRSESPQQKLYQRVFGSKFQFDRVMSQTPKIHELRIANSTSLLFWEKTAKGSLIAFLPEIPKTFDIIKHEISREPKEIWVIVDLVSRRYFCRGARWKSWKNDIQKALSFGNGRFQTTNYLGIFNSGEKKIWIFHAHTLNKLSLRGIRVGILSATIMAVLWRLFFFLKTGNSSLFHRSLKSKLLWGFVAAILMPIGLIISMGMSFFEARAKALEDKTHEEAVSRLQEVDLLYPEWHMKTLNSLRKIRDTPEIISNTATEALRSARSFFYKESLANIETRDRYGNILISIGSTSQRRNLQSALANRILELYFKSDKKQEHYQGNAHINKTLKTFGSINDLLEHRDSLFFFQAGSRMEYLYWDFRQPTSDKPTAIIFAYKEAFAHISNFLKAKLPVGIHANQVNWGLWVPSELSSKISRFSEIAIKQNQVQKLITNFGNDPTLISIYPSKILPGLGYITLSDLKPLLDAIFKQKCAFVFVTIFLGFFGILLAGVLARLFLNPIEEISKGVTALEQRSFKHRIPLLEGNEFRQLSDAFNKMMEERQDLDSAREVQRHIYPEQSPIIPNYDLAFKCISRTQLGGDYCDIIPVAKSKILLLVADVTGHGISAALITTMAKTVVTTSVRQGKSLDVILTRLDKMVREVLIKKKIMSIIAGILDIEKHEFEYFCAGHPFPLHRSENGEISELSLVQVPLGVTRKFPWKSAKVILAKGDALLFFTDGVFESENTTGCAWGYDRLSESLSRLRNCSAEEIIQGILTDLKSHTGQAVPDDDMTLLALRRK